MNIRNFIAKILVISLFVTILPYQQAMAKNDMPATPTPTLGEGQYDEAGSIWEWQHEDTDGGRWVVIHTIAQKVNGQIVYHKIKYGQDAANLQTTFSMVDYKNETRSLGGQYWFKMETYDDDGVSGYNIYIYIHSRGTQNPPIPSPSQTQITPPGEYNRDFADPSYLGTIVTSAKKAYGLYKWVYTVPKGKMQDAGYCIDKGQTAIVRDVTGVRQIENLGMIIFGATTGYRLENTYTNAADETAMCMQPVMKFQYGDKTKAVENYLTATNDYLNSRDIINKPNVTEEFITPEEISEAGCKSPLGNEADAKNTFMKNYDEYMTVLWDNAVDNNGNSIVVPGNVKDKYKENTINAMNGDMPDITKINSFKLPGVDWGGMYQQYYGGYGIKNYPGSGYGPAPDAQYPNMFYDKNMLDRMDAPLKQIESRWSKKPTPENALTLPDKKVIDMEKTQIKAAEAVTKKNGGSVPNGGLTLPQASWILTGVAATGLILAKTGVFAAAWGGVKTAAVNYGIAMYLDFGVAIESAGATIGVALGATVILIALAVALTVLAITYANVDKYYNQNLVKAQTALLYSTFLASNAADFHACMLQNSVKANKMDAAKAIKLGLTDENVKNEMMNIAYGKNNYAKSVVTNIKNAGNCPDINLMNMGQTLQSAICNVFYMLNSLINVLANGVRDFMVNNILSFNTLGPVPKIINTA
ncbi:MAG: hypothetical protein WCG48_01745 [Candidatus Berkelbacteria bacterium]